MMNFTDLKKGFWFSGSIVILAVYIVSMILTLIAKTIDIFQAGIFLTVVWLIAGLLFPVCIQFFSYKNFRPFWFSLLWATGAGIFILALNSVFILLNGCNSSVDGCTVPFHYSILYICIMLVLIFIATVIIAIKDWAEHVAQMRQPPIVQ
jgi:hypothetical protein